MLYGRYARRCIVLYGLGPLPEELRQKWIVTSPTKLIELRKSPAHYYHNVILKQKEETESMKLGTLIHLATLEPEKFKNEFCTIPDMPSFSNDELKAQCEALGLKKSGTKQEMSLRIKEINPEFTTLELETEKLEKEGKKVLSSKQWTMLETIVKKIYQRPTSGFVLKKANKESLGYCQLNDEVIMTFCVDAWMEHNGKGILLDLKTSNDTTSDKILRSNLSEGRNIQLASYTHVMEKITGLNFEGMSYFLFADINPPYAISEYKPDEAMFSAGHSERNVLIKKLMKCHKENHWPDPQAEIENTSLATWDFGKILTDDEHLL